MGAGWCPPGMLGIGIGGTAEKAMMLAKESLMEEINMDELLRRGPENKIEELRMEIFEKVNALGIGAQGLGGLTTVLDIKIKDYPCHAAGKPVGMIPNCAATRHAHFQLDGTGVAHIQAPKLEDYPSVTWDSSTSKRVDLDTITQEEMNAWQPGDTLLLNGTIYTGVTSNLLSRYYEHKNGIKSGFCSKYGCNILVYYEFYENMESAIIREKQIKNGSRIKKIQLIESTNPKWLDLINNLI